MSVKAKVRLLLLAGVILMAVTTLIVLYGFKRTEELQQERHVVALMKEPRTASFGVPVGLTMGPGSEGSVAELNATFEDGVVATLVGIEKRPCTGCGPGGEPVALIRLSGGRLPAGANVVARVSMSSLEWRDRGYLVTLLSIDGSGSAVFTLNPD